MRSSNKGPRVAKDITGMHRVRVTGSLLLTVARARALANVRNLAR